MLRKLLDSGIGDAITVFCNTGKERLETLDFVHEVETRWGVPIVWLEYHRVPAEQIPSGVFPTSRRNLNLEKSKSKGETTHWFKQVDYLKASRNGEPFDEMLSWSSALPNVTSRICSTQLKLRTAMRFLFSNGVKEYGPHIGIRKDESHRATEILASCDSFEYPTFPLVEMGISESHVMDFWRKNDFDLRLQSYEGNCDLCFLKAKWKRMRLMIENPGMAEWWKNWEKNKITDTPNGRTFRLGETYSDVEQQALNENSQQQFCFVSQKDQDIPCSCAERAFGPEDDE